MATVKFNAKGGVVIPIDLRQKYGWKPGSQATVVDYGGIVALVPVLGDPIEEGFGLLKGRGPSLLDALKRERLEERRREEKRQRRNRS